MDCISVYSGEKFIKEYVTLKRFQVVVFINPACTYPHADRQCSIIPTFQL